MSWWPWGKEKKAPGASPKPPPPWLGADDPGNPFGVPILSLMENLQLISCSDDPSAATQAISWRPGHHGRLTWDIEGDTFECSIEYPVEEPLPDGLLFTPAAMEDKWVLAWKQGRIAAARSWSGVTQVVADTQVSGDRLRITRLTIAKDAGLPLFGDPVAAFHWMLETHALGRRIPFPASREGAEGLRQAPLAAMTLYGHRLFCAAVDHAVLESTAPLRSDGALVAAVLEGNIDAARSLLDQGCRLTTPSPRGGYRPIHFAVTRKDDAMTRYLLSRGADPDQAADGLRRPLSLAIVVGCDEALVELLLSSGADLEGVDAKGFRPLHAAAEEGRADAARFLHHRGATLMARTENGLAPIHIACALGHLDAAKALASLGADVHAASPLGTPLEIARQEGKGEVVSWLEGAR